MATYYDYILAGIPISLIGVGGGLSLFGVPTQTALVGAGLVTLGLVGHALFVKAPTGTPGPTENEADVDGSPPPVSMSD